MKGYDVNEKPKKNSENSQRKKRVSITNNLKEAINDVRLGSMNAGDEMRQGLVQAYRDLSLATQKAKSEFSHGFKNAAACLKTIAQAAR